MRLREILILLALLVTVPACSTLDKAKEAYQFVKSHVYVTRAPVGVAPVYQWTQEGKRETFVRVGEGWILIPPFSEWVKGKEPD